jgi:outer membrane protein OmpA-like peptidoglycan-associated protein
MKTILFFMLWMSFLNVFSQEKRNELGRNYQLKLRAFDAENQESLEGTYMKLYNRSKMKVIDSAMVKNGYAIFKLEKGNDYDIVGQFDQYMTRRANFNAACYLQDPKKVFCVSGIVIENISKLSATTDLVEAAISLKKINLNDIFQVENIHYDFSKWSLREDAQNELKNLIQILKDNPGIVVELGSHTDSRASTEFNMTLSQRRAEIAVGYIVKKGGIPKERISAKGYGEMQLLNRCEDGVNCSEREHAMNRRTEIRILGYVVNGTPVELKSGTAITGAKN